MQRLSKLFDELHPELPTEGFVSDSYANDYAKVMESDPERRPDFSGDDALLGSAPA